MTTLAYRDGVFAYDSFCVAGTRIVDNDFDKKIERDGLVCFMCGDAGSADKVIDMYLDGLRFDEDEIETSVVLFVIDGDQLLQVGIDEGYIFINKLDPKKYYSLGSGGDYSLCAMDLGASAKDSIKSAIKRCIYTGGRIRTYKTQWAK